MQPDKPQATTNVFVQTNTLNVGIKKPELNSIQIKLDRQLNFSIFVPIN
ncbi:MAG: hypothetical protein ACPGEC_02235 [Flavobacteriales bacterium]